VTWFKALRHATQGRSILTNDVMHICREANGILSVVNAWLVCRVKYQEPIALKLGHPLPFACSPKADAMSSQTIKIAPLGSIFE